MADIHDVHAAAIPLEQRLSDVVGQLQHIVETQGGPAIKGAAHIAGTVYQMQAIGDLVMFIAYLLMLALLTFALGKIWPWSWRVLESGGKRVDVGLDEVTAIFSFMIGGLAVVWMTIGTLYSFFTYFLDPLVWASVIDPNVALAAHVLQAL